MPNKLCQIPINPKLGCVDFLDLKNNISMIDDLLKLVFAVPINSIFKKLDETTYELSIRALNPANDTVWVQHFNIYREGFIGVNGGQQKAAWVWRRGYCNKLLRIINFWLSENKAELYSEKRIQHRNSLIKQELLKFNNLNIDIF